MEPQVVAPRFRKKTDPQSPLARRLRVWGPDGQEVRMGTILNISLVIGMVFSIVAPAFFIAIYDRGLFNLTPPILMTMSVVSLLWHGVSLARSNWQNYRRIAAAYVGFTYGFFTLSVLLVGGSRSSLWVLFLWPIVIANIFLTPKAVVGLFLGLLLLWGALFVGEQNGFYTSPFTTEAEAQVRYIPLFFLAMLSMCISALVYVFHYLSSTQQALEHTAQALEGYRRSLESQVQERTDAAARFSRQLEVLQALNRIIVLAADMDDLLHRAAQLMSEAFEAYQVMIFLVDESGERLVQQTTLLTTDAEVPMAQLRIGQEGIVGHAAATGKPYVTEDVAADPYYRRFATLEASVSAAAIPIMMQEQVIGVVALESVKQNTFTQPVVEVLVAMANVLGVAILNMRNLGQLRALLGRLSQYEEQEFLAQWRRVFERRQGRIGLLYDRVQVRPLEAAEHLPLLDATPVQASVTLERPDGTHVLLVPLNVRERPLGRLMFESDQPWRQEARALVEAVTAQLGLALENARLLEATRRSAALEATAGELTSRFRQQIELEAVLQQALEDLAQALAAERAVVRLIPLTEKEAQAS